jgi:hypothetical protein
MLIQIFEHKKDITGVETTNVFEMEIDRDGEDNEMLLWRLTHMARVLPFI